MPAMRNRAAALLFTVAALLVQTACADPNRVAGPGYDLLDGRHAGGNPHFFFLPPVLPVTQFGGTFDGTLSPTVEICAWSTSCGAVLATFTMTTGEGSERVRVDAAAEHYIVNWHTGRYALNAASTYRIRVSVGSTELGHVDVAVGSNQQLRDVDTGQLIPVKAGSTLPIKFRIEAGALHDGAGDLVAPTLNYLSFAPAVVDVTNAAATVNFTVRASDDLSGVRSVSFELRSLSGQSVSCLALLFQDDPLRIEFGGFSGALCTATAVTGTRRAPELSFSATVQQGSEPGDWHVTDIGLGDVVGNTRSVSEAALIASGFPTVLSVWSGPDLTPPALRTFDFAPRSVDATAGSATFEVTARAFDAGVGVRSISFEFRSPSGQSIPCSVLLFRDDPLRIEFGGFSGAACVASAVTGTRQEPEVRFTATVLSSAESGDWHVSGVGLGDNLGNSSNASEAMLVASGFPTVLTVASNQDLTAPLLDDFSFTPQTVNVASGPGHFEITLRAHDDRSGVRRANFSFRSPTGQSLSCSVILFADDPLRIEFGGFSGAACTAVAATGTRLAPGLRFDAALPQFSEGGEWVVTDLGLIDGAGNARFFTGADLAARGFPTRLIVISGN